MFPSPHPAYFTSRTKYPNTKLSQGEVEADNSSHCNDITIPAALAAHSDLIYAGHLICSHVQLPLVDTTGGRKLAWYIVKWLLVSILYTVSTLLVPRPLPRLSVRQRKFWEQGKWQLTRVHFLVFTMAVWHHYMWPLIAGFQLYRSHMVTYMKGIIWPYNIGGIISQNWVHEPASSHIDEWWLCGSGKTTDSSACKDKTSSYNINN